MVLLFANHLTFHGYTGDTRYLVPYLALALIPAPLLMQWVYDRSRPAGAILVTLFGVGTVRGALGAISTLAHSWGKPEWQMPFPYDTWWPHPLEEMQKALSNSRNLLWCAAVYAVLAAIDLGLLWGVGALKQPHPSQPPTAA